MPQALLWILIALEGALVMVSELCSAAILTPFFGNSLYVWASTIGITLGGLAIGYLLGSFLATKSLEVNKIQLRWLLILASALSMSMPFIGKLVMPLFLNMNLGLGSSLSLICFLLPVLICLGACSPLFINLINHGTKNAGDSAGKVYAFSTIGGVIMTFISGFILIPYFGIKITLLLSSIPVALLAIFAFRSTHFQSNFIAVPILTTGIIFCSFSEYSYNSSVTVLEESDGILGNIKIVDHDSEGFTNPPKKGRGLVVNNTLQTFYNLEGPEFSLWPWAHLIPSIAGTKAKESNALLIGLGGGTIYKQFQTIGLKTDVVEIDKRIEDYAKKYFEIPNSLNVYIDDGRHFLKCNEKKYDLICFDAFQSESPPGHLLTKEGILEAANSLTEEGFIIINFFGFTSGVNGYASRSVMKTILDSNLNLDIIPTTGKEEFRNLILVIYKNNPPDYFNTRYQEPDKQIYTDWEKRILTPESFNLSDAEVLIDEKPILNILSRNAAEIWRKGYTKYYTNKLYHNK